MVRYRKPVKLSDNIIDRRLEHGSHPTRAQQPLSRKNSTPAELEMLEEAVMQAMKWRNRRPR